MRKRSKGSFLGYNRYAAFSGKKVVVFIEGTNKQYVGLLQVKDSRSKIFLSNDNGEEYTVALNFIRKIFLDNEDNQQKIKNFSTGKRDDYE